MNPDIEKIKEEVAREKQSLNKANGQKNGVSLNGAVHGIPRKYLISIGAPMLALFLLALIGFLFFQFTTTQEELISQTPTQNLEDLPSIPATQGEVRGSLVINLPTLYEDSITVRGDAIFEGQIISPNIINAITVGTGLASTGGQSPTLSNTGVLSLAGETGVIELLAGEGIEIDGLTISSTSEAQNTFSVISAGGSTFSAEGPDDILRFIAGNGITISTNTGNNELIITSTTPWSQSGNSVFLTNSSSNVGIGTLNPTEKLEVAGNILASGSLQIGGNGESFTSLTGRGLANTSNSLEIHLLDTADASSSTTFSPSGLEFAGTNSDQLTLLQGCSNGQILKWDGPNGIWECSADIGGLSSAVVNVEEGGVTVTSTADTLNFSASDFMLTESPSGRANVNIDYLNSGIVRSSQNEIISETWTFSSNAPLAFSSTTPVISIGNTGTLSITDGTDTLLTLTDAGTTGNLGVTGNITASGSILTGGTQRINALGNLVNIGTTQFNGITYTWPATDGADQFVLSTDGSGNLTWMGAEGTINYWQRAEGKITPLAITDDFLTGATATSSALVRLPGTANQHAWFSLGTGNLGIGNNNPTNAKLDVTGGIYATNGLEILAGSVILPAGSINNAELEHSSLSLGGVTLSLGSTDPTPAFDLQDATNLPITSGTTGILTTDRGGTGSNLSSAFHGSIPYINMAQNFGTLAPGNTGYVLMTQGAGQDPTWVDPGSFPGSSQWQQIAGSLAPLDITNDLLLGSTATSSALVRLPGTTNQHAWFTLGTGNLGIGTTTPTHKLDIAGGTNLSSGNSYAINGSSVLSSTTLGSGVTSSSLTTVGALSSGSIVNGFGSIATTDTITGTVLNATTGVNTGAGAGTLRIDASGSLVNIGTTQLNGVTYTWPGADATNPGYVLTSNSAGILSWQEASGIGGVGDITAVGNVTTGDAFTSGGSGSSQFFHHSTFEGELTVGILDSNQTYTLPNISGTFCLSSGNCAGTGAGIGGSGVTNFIPKFSGTYDLSNSSIYDDGNVGIGTTTPGYTLDISGTLGVTNDTTLTGDLAVNGGDITSTATTFNLLSSTVTTLNMAGSATTHFAGGYGSTGLTIDTGGSLSMDGNLVVDGTTSFGGQVYDWSGATVSNGYILATDASGVLSWIDPGDLPNTNLFQLNDGALAPLNITNDLLLGGSSTNSALIKFSGTLGENSWFNTGGNLGVGTSTPLQPLHIATAGNDPVIHLEAQATSTATNKRYPSTGAQENVPVGGAVWNNPQNVSASDNSYASSGASTGSLGTTDYLNVSDYGFTIPTGSTINGIVVEIEKSSSTTAGRDLHLQMRKNGVREGDNKADTTTPWTTTDSTASYGGSTDLWGTTWTAEEINNTNFGVSFRGERTTGGTVTLNVDTITITVYYTPPSNTTWALGGHIIENGSFKISNSSSLGTNDFFTINTSGNVGIGTTTPGAKLDVVGDFILSGTTQLNGVTYTWPGADATNPGYVLSSNGSGALSWTDPSSLGTNYWQLDEGAVVPLNISNDILLGSTATSSALVRLPGTSDQHAWFTLGTGNLGIGTTTPTHKLDIAGGTNLSSGNSYAINGSSVLSSTTLGSTVTSSSLTSVGTITSGTWNGTAIGTTYGGTGIDTASATGVPTIAGGTWSISSSLPTALGGLGANMTAVGAGELIYSTGTTTYGSLAAGTAGYILQSSGAGAPTWVDASTVGVNYWQLDQGALAPINTTNDLLVGASATTSALIRLGGTTGSDSWIHTGGNMGIGTTTPGAALDIVGDFIVSGTTTLGGEAYTWPGSQTAGYVLSTDGSGGLSWVALGSPGTNYWQLDEGALAPLDITNDLLLGSTATSSALVRLPGTTNQHAWFTLGTGNLGIGTTTPTHKLDIAGGLNISSGSVYNINGSSVLSSTTLGSTVTSSSLTSVGALSSGSITTGFGSISTSDSITGTTMTASGTTGFVSTGTGAGLNFQGSGNHLITASGGTLQLSATTLTGTITGNSQNITGLGTASFGSGNVSITGSAIGLTSDTDLLSLASGVLTINGVLGVTGDTTLNGVTYAWPNAQASGPNQVLINDGTGELSWLDPGQIPSQWIRMNNSVSPYDITDDVLIGSHATSSALMRFPGIPNEDAWFNLGTGNLGIGTTAPSNKLHIEDEQFALIRTVATDPITDVVGFFGSRGDGTDQVQVGSTSLHDLVLFTNNTPRIAVLSTGNVGIGTTTPGSFKLNVSGDTNVTGTITATGTTGALTLSGNGATINFSGTGVSQITTASGQHIALMPGGTGNVGIGTTTPGSFKLSVNGNVGFAASSYLNFGTTAGNSGYGIRDIGGYIEIKNSGGSWISPLSGIGGSGTSGYITAFTGSNSIGNSPIFQTSGNIGIGTTNPADIMHLQGSGNLRTFIESTGTGYAGARYKNSNKEYFFGVNADRFSITDNTLGQERISLSTSGNVGIGFTNPVFKLDVGGSIGIASTGEALRLYGSSTIINFSGTVGAKQITTGGNTTLALMPGGTGRVGIGTTDPDINSFLHVNGTLRAATFSSTGAGSVCRSSEIFRACTSLAAHKTDIRDMNFGLETISLFRPVTYNWVGTGDDDFGFIAEEVEAINPLFAEYDNGELIGVKFRHFPALLTKGIQELDTRTKTTNLTLAGQVSLNNLQTSDIQGLSSTVNALSDAVDNLSMFSLDDYGNVQLSQDENDNWVVLDSNGDIINNVSAFSEATIANLKTGKIESEDIFATDLVATSGLFNNISASFLSSDSIAINDTLSAGRITTDEITMSDFKVINDDSKLAIIDSITDTTLFSVDLQGNAEFSGSVTTPEIIADEGTIETLTVTNLIVENISGLTASSSAFFNLGAGIEADFAEFDFTTINADLTVLGSTTLREAAITESLAIGAGEMMINSNSINTLSDTLEIQPLKQQPVSIMAGAITIETDGTVTFTEDVEFEKDVAVKGTLTAQTINVATDEILNISATVSQASASAGVATITAGETTRIIENPHVTDNSLIYVTPVSDVFGETPFIFEQQSDTSSQSASFTVKIKNPVAEDIKFNFLIIN